MVLVQKSGRQNANNASSRGSKLAKQRKRQKIVLESMSQEKSKLQSVISFRADPPPGYTFIPAGNPELTAALKEFARKGDYKIFAVTTTPHAARHELSREVHRIGFHFPTAVVSQVCSHYGIRLTSGGKLINEDKDNDKIFMRVYQKGELVLDEKVQDQVTINTEAKQIIKDLFPNIPDKDLFQIIKTAFQLGDNKVGTADEIPLVRRAQLSVVAHVRHIYTEYDKLLRKVPYNEARHRVEKETLQKLVEWRGDDDAADEAGNKAVEDIFREVIVISDEEDSDSDRENEEVFGNEDLHIEELPSSTYATANARPFSAIGRYENDDAPPGYRFVPQIAHRYRPTETQVALHDRNRYEVWNRARQDYRSAISNRGPDFERVYVRDSNAQPSYTLSEMPSHNTGDQILTRSAKRPVDSEVRTIIPPSPSRYIRGSDGILYERIVSRAQEQPQHVFPQSEHNISSPVRSHVIITRPSSPAVPSFRAHGRTPSLDDSDGTILPSIEGPNGQYALASRRNPFGQAMEGAPGRQAGVAHRSNFTHRREPRQIEFIDDDVSRSSQRPKDVPLDMSEAIDRRYVPEEEILRRENRVYVSQAQAPFPEVRRIIDLGEPLQIAPSRSLREPVELSRVQEARPSLVMQDQVNRREGMQRRYADAFDQHESEHHNTRPTHRSYADARMPLHAEEPPVKRVLLADDSHKRYPLAEKLVRVHGPPVAYESHKLLDSAGRYIRDDFPQEYDDRRVRYVEEPRPLSPGRMSSVARQYTNMPEAVRQRGFSAHSHPPVSGSQLGVGRSETAMFPSDRRYERPLPSTYPYQKL